MPKFKLAIAIMALLAVVLIPLKLYAETIKVGYFKLEPHAMIVEGKHSGAAIDYWEKHIAPAMKVDIIWVGPLPPARLLAELEAGRINAIALLKKNEVRANKFDYPMHSYFTTPSTLALLKEHPLNEIKSIDDILPLKIGFFAKGFVPVPMRNKNIKWEYVEAINWLELNMKKVLTKRIDAAYVEIYAQKYMRKRLGAEDKIKILKIPDSSDELYSIFSKKDKGRFLNKYDRIHEEIRNKVNYSDLMKKYVD